MGGRNRNIVVPFPPLFGKFQHGAFTGKLRAEAVAITFKMDAKNKDCNEHEQRKVRCPALRSVLGPILSCFLFIFTPLLIDVTYILL